MAHTVEGTARFGASAAQERSGVHVGPFAAVGAHGMPARSANRVLRNWAYRSLCQMSFRPMLRGGDPMAWWASLSKQHGTTRPSHVRTAPCHMRQHASSRSLRKVHWPVARVAVVPPVLRGLGEQRVAVTWVVELGGLDLHLVDAARFGRVEQASGARVRWVPPRGIATRRAVRDSIRVWLQPWFGFLPSLWPTCPPRGRRRTCLG